jgi:hypothetical protein
MRDVTDKISGDIGSIPDLSDLNNGLDIANRASDCACCGASASISAYVKHTKPQPFLPTH